MRRPSDGGAVWFVCHATIALGAVLVRVTCAFCEVQYDLKQCDYDKKVRRGVTRFFCSTACRGKDYSARHAHPCKQCGAPIVGDRHRVYCSSACKAGAAPNPQQWRRSFAPRACGHCRYEFVPSSSRTRYCSQGVQERRALAAHDRRRETLISKTAPATRNGSAKCVH
jgi:hypothetical protein